MEKKKKVAGFDNPVEVTRMIWSVEKIGPSVPFTR